MIRIAGTVPESSVDGPGVRYVIFTQGCCHYCKDCHNQDTWDPKGGELVPLDKLIDEIVSSEIIDGITISGGEPFLQTEACLKLVINLRKVRPDLTIVVYTGFRLEYLLSDPIAKELIKQVDFLIDGEYQKDNKKELAFRGSTNQRCIQMLRIKEEDDD